MKTSITFKHGPAPTYSVEGSDVGLVGKIDIDLNMTTGTMTIEKLHVTPFGRLAWADPAQPTVPVHPCIVIEP